MTCASHNQMIWNEPEFGVTYAIYMKRPHSAPQLTFICLAFVCIIFSRHRFAFSPLTDIELWSCFCLSYRFAHIFFQFYLSAWQRTLSKRLHHEADLGTRIRGTIAKGMCQSLFSRLLRIVGKNKKKTCRSLASIRNSAAAKWNIISAFCVKETVNKTIGN